MKKLMRNMALLCLCVCLLCGCTESTVIETSDYSDLPQPGPDGLVWEQIWEDWRSIYEDTAAYPFIDTVNASIDSENGSARFFLLTNSVISEEEAIQFAMEAVKGFSDVIREQDLSLEPSGSDSFGGYLKPFEIYVMVGPDGTKADRSTWILEDTVPAGEYREFHNSTAAE